ncbi:MAG: hypothetical protein ABSG53_09000 [Thermoguttaceae bacterium]|jgi:hypothetical protein
MRTALWLLFGFTILGCSNSDQNSEIPNAAAVNSPQGPETKTPEVDEVAIWHKLAMEKATKTRGLTLALDHVSEAERFQRVESDKGFCTGEFYDIRYFERNLPDGSPKEAWSERIFNNPPGSSFYDWQKDGDDIFWYGLKIVRTRTIVYKQGKVIQVIDPPIKCETDLDRWNEDVKAATKTRGLTLALDHLPANERLERTTSEKGFCTGQVNDVYEPVRYYEKNYADGRPKEYWEERKFSDGWCKDSNDVVWFETEKNRKRTIVYEHGKVVNVFDF